MQKCKSFATMSRYTPCNSVYNVVNAGGTCPPPGNPGGLPHLSIYRYRARVSGYHLKLLRTSAVSIRDSFTEEEHVMLLKTFK
jgi:hypothetical protein